MDANPRPKPFHNPNAVIADPLLRWYDRHARDLPWRVGPSERAAGEQADPYRVWLSEIMLQQTTVPHATRYFMSFVERWPTVDALAAAADDEVMAAWAGLGYYARARNLLKCARMVAASGHFPETRDGLRALPGIGAYTSGAVAAIAFGEPVPAVDGNVDRVFARLLALDTDWKTAKKTIADTVATIVPDSRPGEFAEALMDLGATVCTPKRPNCLLCPLADHCKALAEGKPERYPIKAKKAVSPTRRGHAFLLRRDDTILLERRPARGLLGGMLGLPGSEWTEEAPTAPDFPIDAHWNEAGDVRHVFTHFNLVLTVWTAEMDRSPAHGQWHSVDAVEGLPSVFKKAARLALQL